VTIPESANRVMFNQGVFRLNAQAGADFAGGDVIYPSEFTLTAKRSQAGVYGVGSSYDVIDEPTNDGLPDVKLSLTFPRYSP